MLKKNLIKHGKPVLGVCALLLSAGCYEPPDDATNNNPNNQSGYNCTSNLRPLTNDDVNGGKTLAAGTCYQVASTLEVSDGTLNLQAGVRLAFAENVGLRVTEGGRLKAVGSAEEPVILEGLESSKGFWKGVTFVRSPSTDNVLDHVVIDGAGKSGWHGGTSSGGVFIEGDSTLRVRNSLIRNNLAAGIYAPEDGADLTIESSVFEDNQLPLWLNANLIGRVALGNEFNTNTENVIRVGTQGTKVRDAQTWFNHGVNYEVHADFVVEALLTIEKGTRIEFIQGIKVDVRDTGRLKAIGTADAKIVFSGTNEERGFWQGLRFVDTRSADNVLDHVVIEYAGGKGWHGGADSQGNIFVEGDGVTLVIRNSTLRKAKYAGLIVPDGGSDVTLEKNTFSENEVPLRVHPNVVGKLAADNVFTDNDRNAVFVGLGSARTLSGDQTWRNVGVSYEILGTLTVPSKLTIAPGVTLEFRQAAGLDIHEGKLVANAAGAETITFRGVEALANFWRGIRFKKSMTLDNVFDNTVIENGGSDGWHGGADSRANIYMESNTDASRVSIKDTVVRGSGHLGISVMRGSFVDGCEDLSFADNASANTFTPAENVANLCGGLL
ncbi:MAG: hypothetical protein H0U74_18580 [Bradymonadaceae bacterium]|nr:hypothetical protein [Lujinxingiaceae bacterium]